MVEKRARRTPLLLWPFKALWDLLSFIFRLAGRLVTAVIGLGLMMLGFVLLATILAAPVGIPFMILGFLLLLRALF